MFTPPPPKKKKKKKKKKNRLKSGFSRTRVKSDSVFDDFFYLQLKLKHTPGYIISGLLMILTFFISRICVLPYIYWHYSIYAGIQMYEVPFRLSYYCNLGCLAFLSLQIYWMGLMFRGLYKVVCKIYKMKTKTS